ncbi:TorF family putative porin [Bisbaumannia pacifica]|uniref:TIGR02001 family outer membrane protein n=1 Tax=Bisbaumannia pacifica TaxID=77098 RepID=A0A510XAW7_9GAMM|nr:TorF family putative porin [Halomonas pacifica]MBH8579240.1 hypothetical protein [Halomonas pacifica]GEK48503.1 TIGR02001 family outer membrane protein [Halomonas pacifica]
MKNRSAILLLSTALVAPLAQAEITGNVTLTSDYRVKGISQTGENPAIQGGFDYAHDAGFFAGAWASSVDFFEAGDSWDNDESIEIDLYAGYFGLLGDHASYDVTLYRYFYPGAIDNIDYNELILGADIGPLRLAYGYANDYIDLGEDYHYVEANYGLELPAEFGLELHLGYSFGGFFDDPAAAGLEEYLDYGLTLSRSLAGVDLSLAYLDTDIDAPYAIHGDYLANQEAWVVSLSKGF